MANLFITGVSRGIGRAAAQYFAERGHTVYGCYRWSPEYASEAECVRDLAGQLPGVTLLSCDVADRDRCDEMINQLAGIPLAGVVNNAAIFTPNPWQDFDIALWDKAMEINLTAPLRLVHGLRGQIITGGSVVNMSSTDAYSAGYSDIAYAASKAGLMSLTKSLAALLAPRKIRVNAVANGWTDTGMKLNPEVLEAVHYKTPLGRMSTTQEIVDVIDFLLFGGSSFITGSVIRVDGGYGSVDEVLKREAGY
ncbi:MAG TPA: SDR family oxidoreductase [Mycobacteriales bacterium]|jgi:NAD(P)-dependent dehydrogenase (short-subunit alcohol dehydrogenase family)|nr:SDR family oxidoreductase [Mycobacteriales bacterium]